MARTKINASTVDKDWQRVISSISVFSNEVNAQTARVVQAAAEAILEETIPLVPVETGALRASGRVFVGTAITGRKIARIQGQVSFGGRVRVGRERQVELGGTGDSKNAPDGIVTYAHIIHEGGRGGHAIFTQGQAGFLREGARTSSDKVRRIVREGFKGLAK